MAKSETKPKPPHLLYDLIAIEQGSKFTKYKILQSYHPSTLFQGKKWANFTIIATSFGISHNPSQITKKQLFAPVSWTRIIIEMINQFSDLNLLVSVILF